MIQSRLITLSDEPFLWSMLYEAAQMEKAGEPFSAIHNNSALTRYVEGWGRDHDHGYLIEEVPEEKPISAAWVRMLTKPGNHGYGFVAEGVPELVMATHKGYRRNGAAQMALQSLICHLQSIYPAVSLSVRTDNLPAIRLYEKVGFKEVVGSKEKNRSGGQSFKMMIEL